jgi:CxxC-x17-CxxC domain-containing protein
MKKKHAEDEEVLEEGESEESEDEESEDTPAAPAVEEESEDEESDGEESEDEESEEGEAKETKDKFGRTLYSVKCTECKRETQVPFKPSPGRPVYCRDCFMKHRPKRRF